MRNCRKYFWFHSPTQLLIHGQWWSMRRTQRRQMRQWCARGGRYVSHLIGDGLVVFGSVGYTPIGI